VDGPQDAKPATPAQDDLQSRVEDLADYIAPFVQEGTGKVVVFDLVGPKGLRAPFGNWLADQISTTIAQRYPALQVIDRSTINSLLDKRNRDADHGDSKKDRAFAEQAGAETFISGSFSKTPSGIRINFTGVGKPKPRSMIFFAILPLTDQVVRLLPPGLETETPKGESNGGQFCTRWRATVSLVSDYGPRSKSYTRQLSRHVRLEDSRRQGWARDRHSKRGRDGGMRRPDKGCNSKG